MSFSVCFTLVFFVQVAHLFSVKCITDYTFKYQNFPDKGNSIPFSALEEVSGFKKCIESFNRNAHLNYSIRRIASGEYIFGGNCSSNNPIENQANQISRLQVKFGENGVAFDFGYLFLEDNPIAQYHVYEHSVKLQGRVSEKLKHQNDLDTIIKELASANLQAQDNEKKEESRFHDQITFMYNLDDFCRLNPLSLSLFPESLRSPYDAPLATFFSRAVTLFSLNMTHFLVEKSILNYISEQEENTPNDPKWQAEKKVLDVLTRIRRDCIWFSKVYHHTAGGVAHSYLQAENTNWHNAYWLFGHLSSLNEFDKSIIDKIWKIYNEKNKDEVLNLMSDTRQAEQIGSLASLLVTADVDDVLHIAVYFSHALHTRLDNWNQKGLHYSVSFFREPFEWILTTLIELSRSEELRASSFAKRVALLLNSTVSDVAVISPIIYDLEQYTEKNLDMKKETDFPQKFVVDQSGCPTEATLGRAESLYELGKKIFRLGAWKKILQNVKPSIKSKVLPGLLKELDYVRAMPRTRAARVAHQSRISEYDLEALLPRQESYKVTPSLIPFWDDTFDYSRSQDNLKVFVLRMADIVLRGRSCNVKA